MIVMLIHTLLCVRVNAQLSQTFADIRVDLVPAVSVTAEIFEEEPDPEYRTRITLEGKADIWIKMESIRQINFELIRLSTKKDHTIEFAMQPRHELTIYYLSY